MTLVLILASLGLLFMAGKSRSSRTSRGVPSATRSPTPAATATSAGPEGPPGLLLRREPEIRGLASEALADYVTSIRLWIEAGGRPSIAWKVSYEQAQAEILLRTRVRQPTSGLTPVQLEALGNWLGRLRQAGMSLTTDEDALRINIEEERTWRGR